MIENQVFSEDKLIQRALKMIKQNNIDGIFTISCYPVAICAAISQLSGLPGPSFKSVFLVNHKYYARKFVHQSFQEHWYFGVYQNSTLEEIKAQIKEYPCLLKVCCSMHQVGQKIIRQESKVQAMMLELRDYKEGMKQRNRFYYKYLAEEDRPQKSAQEMPLYMIQKLYNLSQNIEFYWEGVIQTNDPNEKQKLTWYSTGQTDMLKSSDIISWSSPCRYNQSTIEKLNKRFQQNEIRILKEAGYKDASFDLGFFVNKSGKLHVIENNCRFSYLEYRYDEFEGPGIDTVKNYCQICTKSKVTNMPIENTDGKPSFLALIRVYQPNVKVDQQLNLQKVNNPGIQRFKCITPFLGSTFRPVRFTGYLGGATCGNALHKADNYKEGISNILKVLGEIEISRPDKQNEDNGFDVELKSFDINQELLLID